MPDSRDSPNDQQVTPKGTRYTTAGRSRARTTRRVWRSTRQGIEFIRENQSVLPVLGIVLGAILAVALAGRGQDPDPGSWTVTVDRARDTLMGLLSLVFAGLSIALAVATVTTQNVVNRFSLRLLRIYQREFRDKMVIAAFAMTATFIITAQTQLRSEPSDALAPVGTVAGAVFLLFATGALMIWYITTLSTWFRVDRTARRIAEGAIRTARNLEQQYEGLEPADGSAFARPSVALDVKAPRSGFLAGVDIDALFDLAVADEVVIVIDRIDGASMLRRETIGWSAPLRRPSGCAADIEVGALPSDQTAAAIDVSRSLTLEGAVDYRILVLVDMAIMALSPSVNDPNTAVQVIEEMGFLFAELSRRSSGPVARVDAEGRPRVVIAAPTLAEYVELATTQIALYGAADPAVALALRRFFETLAMLELTEHDARAVAELSDKVVESG